jgi:predicted DsbA family dithiol-disulfide isomerase
VQDEAMANETIEVFADVGCPFAYAGLCRFRAKRAELGMAAPLLRVRAWPLEIVNGSAFDGPSVAPKVAALRADVAPDRFTGFDPDRYPTTTLPALALEAAAQRVDARTAEATSFALREAVFEHGRDIADGDVLDELRRGLGVPAVTEADRAAVLRDLDDGRRRGVVGSPHYFTSRGDFFCPSLEIRHDDSGYHVTFTPEDFDRFIDAAFAT